MKRFGLIPKKPVAPRRRVLRDEDDDDEDSGAAGGRDLVQEELIKVQTMKAAQAAKQHAELAAEYPSVFDYDGVYDELKREERARKLAREGVEGDGGKKARYMDKIVETAKARKINLERAKERMAQRERELEGEDQFADKEKFVTSAFLERQKELKRLEEEEERKEAEDARKRGEDPTLFYKNLLEQTSKSVFDPNEKVDAEYLRILEEADRERDETLKNIASNKTGVVLNDSNEVVDHRQLLSAGLNLSSRKLKVMEFERRRKEEAEARRKREEEEARAQEVEKAEREAAERKRRRKQVEESTRTAAIHVEKQRAEMREKQRRAREEEEDRVRKQMAKKADEGVVSDARARYLERQKAKAAARADDE
ncbi:coiled-coil domain-containing protein 55-domain containing protein [Cladochytrium replicatum]|nr:coiled-coil domain-containing protein 55-domain containing protein [Cladochytrium replicatum]